MTAAAAQNIVFILRNVAILIYIYVVKKLGNSWNLNLASLLSDEKNACTAEYIWYYQPSLTLKLSSIFTSRVQ